jgi:DNA invertase Pin-like site-specific DNA recombinase
MGGAAVYRSATVFWTGVAIVVAAVLIPRVGVRVAGGRPAAPPGLPGAGARRAIGYVWVDADGPADELATHSRAISAWCAAQGLTLQTVMHDVDRGAGSRASRPALRGALERIVEGHADTLVVAQVNHLAPNVAKLAPLLDWLTEGVRSVVAVDVRMDTAAPGGREIASALTAVAEWEHDRLSARTRRGLEAARSRGGGGGRASVADVPELRNYIVRMRAAGMTLQAIADTLNEKGVPTLRGGTRWRPSSVQRAAGYRRPNHGRRTEQSLPPGIA